MHGQKIALLGLNHTDFKLDLKKATDQITALHDQGYQVIPFIHWGAEYQHQPTTEQIKFAHAFVDAGAFAVVGMHPHVVESVEIYNHAPIFYSLGNTIFDQNFSQDTQEGLTLAMEISPEKLSIILLPIRIERSQPRLMTPAERTDFLVNKLATWWRYDDQEIKAQIEKGKIVINLAKN
ncbi:CapA family protein [Candidatus Peregrinibacteria bacterium]|nr:CapA family protein [Candidatus Peregrinibacteria bacterium]